MPLRREPLPRMAGHLAFMRAPRVGLADLRPGMVAALGVARDGTGPWGGLTRFGPAALRETSAYFGSHFSANMKSAMDIDRRRVLSGGMMGGSLVDLGDLAVEHLPVAQAHVDIRQAVAAVSSLGATALLLGGDLDIVTPAIEGAQAARRAEGVAKVQLGGVYAACDGAAVRSVLFHVAQDSRVPHGAGLRQQAVSLTPSWVRTADPAALRGRLQEALQAQAAFVVLDLSVFAAHWHGMHAAAPLEGPGLREVRRLMEVLGTLPIAGLAVTGLDATRCGLSTVKTGQRLALTAMLDLLYGLLGPDGGRAAA